MITVIAGVNGAGKSSVIGSFLRARRGEYFNPDEATQRLKTLDGLTQTQANATAWQTGFDLLCRAIDNRAPFAFETTLGGRSITNKLHEAISRGVPVRLLYCGLESVQLHLNRVQARVARGGHDIPEARIRERWVSSVANLCSLVPHCTELVVWDNSAPLSDGKPQPACLFHLRDAQFVQMPGPDIPDWAKPIAVAAMQRVNDYRSE